MAEQVLKLDGVIALDILGEENIHSIADLPKTPFHVVKAGATTKPIPLAVFKELGRCTELTILHLPNETIPDGGLACLRRLKHLKDIWLTGPHVDDTALGYFSECTEMAQMNLVSPKITDEGLTHFKDFTQLYCVQFGCPAIKGAGLIHLKNSPQIKLLGVHRSQLDDQAIKTLIALTNIKSLQIRGTKVSAKGLAELQKARPDLEIEWNQENILPQK